MAAAFDPTRLDWNLLRAFVAVVEQGSLTRAAAHLGTSQPTLSRQVAALEAAVGAPLFERTARRLVPSAVAQAMVEPASRMLAAAEACAHAGAAPVQQLAGSVRLTASQVVSAHVLPPMLARLAGLHPEIQVELVASDTLGNLLEREADIAVRMVQPTQGAVITRHLVDWPLGFFVHRDLLAAAGGTVSPDTLHRLRWIGFDQSTQLIEGFQRAGFAVDKRFFAFRCDNQLVTFEALRAGLGVAIAMVPLAASQPQLVRVLSELELPVLPVWLTAHRELRSSRRLRVVFDFLAEALAGWAGPALAAPPPSAAVSARRSRR
ncbi:LysR family transcriptional regulator [Ideonella sp. A 288]|uniref:LysR family transcriptional regulator n=1 Tax=Ideonella sp. A 288 TaxID=1962181 RepID=UPI000B4A59B8|nr:LysR family transcriptional regulator [Ideonella sp. A 288]